MRKIAVFIDGGHLRMCAMRANQEYNPSFVTAIASALVRVDEFLFRVLYYDCASFSGALKTPISRQEISYVGDDTFLESLAEQELVAVRKGILKFRGWERTRASLKSGKPTAELTDDDFRPKLEQKGVDLRIGFDIITITEHRSADIIILLTGDTDLIPAMKLARQRGIQIAGVSLPNNQLVRDIRLHCDYIRTLTEWPRPMAKVS